MNSVHVCHGEGTLDLSAYIQLYDNGYTIVLVDCWQWSDHNRN